MASILNFDKENSIEIGSTFSATIQLFDAPSLSDYTGVCHVRTDENSNDIIISPTITVNSHDSFTLTIPFGAWTTNNSAGNYKYDVLFSRAGDRFFAIRGIMVFIKGITKIA